MPLHLSQIDRQRQAARHCFSAGDTEKRSPELPTGFVVLQVDSKCFSIFAYNTYSKKRTNTTAGCKKERNGDVLPSSVPSPLNDSHLVQWVAHWELAQGSHCEDLGHQVAVEEVAYHLMNVELRTAHPCLGERPNPFFISGQENGALRPSMLAELGGKGERHR